MAFFLAIDDIVRSVDGKVAEYLYDKEEFISALKQVETDLSNELRPEALERIERLQAAQ